MFASKVSLFLRVQRGGMIGCQGGAGSGSRGLTTQCGICAANWAGVCAETMVEKARERNEVSVEKRMVGIGVDVMLD